MATVLGMGLWACGGDSEPEPDPEPAGAVCSTEARAGLLVVVEGAASCDALSFAVAGDDRLGPEFRCTGDVTCNCYGLWEQPGTFSMTVSDASSGAALGELSDVVIGSDDCHVILETRTLEI